ncbi:hypothetical protein M404DRAFT_1007505 [Pisolithus tinctorius Marx 270]|uniref:Uncharacterized protein n=1 Tax=Pisolithus tinctorius Marx 270 TaxID=870435 RepID=A0A0C3JCK2_PISTI|nr:hypothetical protein M404DRAFT_1007505 [Pisolithus tinctorius Marx 270]
MDDIAHGPVQRAAQFGKGTNNIGNESGSWYVNSTENPKLPGKLRGRVISLFGRP